MDIRFANVGIAVRDLDAAIAFFTDLGMTLQGRDEVRGAWADTAVGLDGNHARIAMLQTPSGDGTLELFEPIHPAPVEREPAQANDIGMHRIALQVDDLDAALAIAARHGVHPLRGVARYEDASLLTYLRGPSGILVMLAEDLQRGSEPTATADLYDERGSELQSLATQLQDVGGRVAFEGPIRTVRCHQDNALLKSILSTPGDGAVLVVDGGGSLATALMGDMIAELAHEHGWAGAVIFGPVRDRVALGGIPIGIKALGSNPAKSTKTGAGEADVVLEVDGVVFTPGRMLWADADGVLVER